MKKFLLALLVISLFVGAASAETIRAGLLSKLNMTQEDFQALRKTGINNGLLRLFYASKETRDDEIIVFYDSLVSMQMALNSGEIDEIILPEAVAEYVMNISGNYEIAGISRSKALASFSLGFRANDDPKILKDKVNNALLEMKLDGTLAILRSKYIDEPGIGDPVPVKFEHYNGADTVKVAVTGDIPPIDFIAANGTPAGFNTAVLSEISKRLHINIDVINIESGARAAALASRRADVVFWVQSRNDNEFQADIPEGIALSEPYYSWNEYLHLKKK